MVSLQSPGKNFNIWLVLYILLVLFAYSCRDKISIQQDDKITNIIKNVNIQDDWEIFVIVPKYICLECNTRIFNYYRQINSSNKKVKFLFFNEEDYVRKFIPEYKNSRSIEFLSYHDSLAIKYPTILWLENEKVIRIEYQNINNPYAFEKLIKRIE